VLIGHFTFFRNLGVLGGKESGSNWKPWGAGHSVTGIEGDKKSMRKTRGGVVSKLDVAGGGGWKKLRSPGRD